MPNKELKLRNSKRTYILPGNEKVVINNPRKLTVKPSGTHHVTDSNGVRHIVNKTWLACIVD